MRGISLRQRMVAVVIIFTILIFAVVQMQHSSRIKTIVLDAEESRNLILIDTMLPILETNLAFGLLDSNRLYLDTIAKKNDTIIKMRLEDVHGNLLYNYSIAHPKHEYDPSGHFAITKTISDNVTQSLLATLEVEFSHRYYNAMLTQNRSFAFEYFLIIAVMLLFMLMILRYINRPYAQLLKKIKTFDPTSKEFDLRISSYDGEISMIQNALSDMFARLRIYHDDLNELNTTLEQKVQKRTAALSEEIRKVKEQEKMLISQSRLAAMGEMMSMIAHQWRQPLATSTLMITEHKIKAMLENQSDDPRDAILDTISETLLYLSDTIDDFQTYFKPDKVKAECQIEEVINRSVNFSKARLKTYGITLHVECDESIMVMSYFNELVQIVLNIINNAIDAITAYHPAQKEITVSCEKSVDAVCIHITDSGGGVPEAIKDRIFEPYFSTKGKNGTGLGLYMAKMIIDRHIGGEFLVQNIDDGARFTIKIWL